MLGAVVPQVCSRVLHTFFCLRTGSLCCHWRPRPRAGHHHPKGSDSLCPVRSNLSGRPTHRIPSPLLSPRVHTLFLGRTAECCVRHSRAGLMRAQNAVRGATSQPHYRDLAQLAGIGRYCRCLSMPSLTFARDVENPHSTRILSCCFLHE